MLCRIHDRADIEQHGEKQAEHKQARGNGCNGRTGISLILPHVPEALSNGIKNITNPHNNRTRPNLHPDTHTALPHNRNMLPVPYH